MEYLNLHEMSVEETRALIASDPTSYIKAFMEEQGWDNSDLSYYSRRENDVNGFTFEVVYSEGGCEGGGEHAERVLAVVHNGKKLAHFRIIGFYQSYDGTEWEPGFEIVYPREVFVTQYFNEP